LAAESAKEEARAKRIKDDQAELERQRQIKLAKEEAERLR